MMAIEFSEITRSILDWSYINSSAVDIYIDPTNGREFDDDFNLTLCNFTWSVDRMMKNYLFIQLNFTYEY